MPILFGRAGDRVANDFRNAPDSCSHYGLPEGHRFTDHPPKRLLPARGLANNITGTEDSLEKRIGQLAGKRKMGVEAGGGYHPDLFTQTGARAGDTEVSFGTRAEYKFCCLNKIGDALFLDQPADLGDQHPVLRNTKTGAEAPRGSSGRGHTLDIDSVINQLKTCDRQVTGRELGPQHIIAHHDKAVNRVLNSGPREPLPCWRLGGTRHFRPRFMIGEEKSLHTPGPGQPRKGRNRTHEVQMHNGWPVTSNQTEKAPSGRYETGVEHRRLRQDGYVRRLQKIAYGGNRRRRKTEDAAKTEEAQLDGKRAREHGRAIDPHGMDVEERQDRGRQDTTHEPSG